MGKDTTISWTDSTVNPTMGCDGCELWGPKNRTCYAGVLHERYGGVNKGFSPKFEILTEHPGRMKTAAAWSDLIGTNRPEKPWLNRMPRLIFVSDMSDALSKDVSFEYLKAEIIDTVYSTKGRRHIWQWLTKQPARMTEFSFWLRKQGIAWPRNLWAGTSITRQPTLSRAKMLTLVGDQTTTRFLSVEPMLEKINLRELTNREISWVIVGCESGPHRADMNPDWARSIAEQCKNASVAFWMKQMQIKGKVTEQMGEFPEDLRIREMPKVEQHG